MMMRTALADWRRWYREARHEGHSPYWIARWATQVLWALRRP